ncbi:7-carboxy-7-deazaguanine synthase QueE [Tuberibacillus sp. Marseille-P3662]|uniref:7-carboxy-7-deazaguanine synthase QueE n=1 Tax=Tuberibacillus sp. Marseille-P3662 TaxID=1965358 RepID=UPI0020CB1D93|nr:radical SAM protein [Tuberibacillus sp. Marseille-P3662]
MPKTMTEWQLPVSSEYLQWKLPMVEIFETIEGEGTGQGFPTVFVRMFHCNLRCSWCDTPYSYAPDKPEYEATIAEIIERISQFSSQRICFTGGEPLIHREKSAALLQAMADLDHIQDIHIETNGAIDLTPYEHMRHTNAHINEKVRFVMDYKLPDSGETSKMIHTNFDLLTDIDEVKFVIGSDEDFSYTKQIIDQYHGYGQVLLSPVWDTMHPQTLVQKMLAEPMPNAKLSMQMHKVIWHPDTRGV